MLLVALAMPQAQAQQSGGSRPQAGATALGAGGSAANRGGAAGVANPDPGGGAAEPAGPLGGPAGTTTRRPGYLGGRATEGGGGGTVVVVPPPRATEFSCHDVNPSAMSPVGRMSGENVERIDGARKTVHPARGAGRGQSARFLLASFQEELAKPAPDFELAGTYLGMASGQPVTAEVALRVSEILCVPLDKAQAANVSAVAEGQRLRLEASGR
jgi:hypothetical protein